MRHPKQHVFLLIFLFLSITAYAQNETAENNLITIDISKITNPVAKSAFQDFQNADEESWLSHFTSDVTFTDDGNPRDFRAFTESALGSEEFTSIDSVENDGKDIYGNFHSDQWGDFKVFFKFHINEENKIYRLDIGQAN